MTSPTDLPTHGFYSLDELCDALNRIKYDEFGSPLTWDHRFPRTRQNEPDFYSLPTFGGTEPFVEGNGHQPSYSWDRTRALVEDEYELGYFWIVPRPDRPAHEPPAPVDPTIVYIASQHTVCDYAGRLIRAKIGFSCVPIGQKEYHFVVPAGTEPPIPY